MTLPPEVAKKLDGLSTLDNGTPTIKLLTGSFKTSLEILKLLVKYFILILLVHPDKIYPKFMEITETGMHWFATSFEILNDYSDENSSGSMKADMYCVIPTGLLYTTFQE